MSGSEKWRRAYRREDTKDQLKRNVDSELQAHLEMRVEQLRAQGLSEEEARARARGMLGDVAGAATACKRTDRRWLIRERAGLILGSLIKDVGYALRIFRTDPLFAAMASFCLAVGITFTAVTYTLLDGTLLNPLPFDDGDELVMVGRRSSFSGAWTWMQSSFTDFRDWEDENHVFQDLAAFTWKSFTITDLDNPVRLTASEVTDALDEVLGVGAALGRTFTPADFAPGAERVVLLGHAAWQRVYGGDPGVVGRLITLSEEHRHRVVGIMPPNFTFPDSREMWIPFPPEGPRNAFLSTYVTIGRLRDGVPIETAQAEMTEISARLAALRPEREERREVQVVPFGPHLFRALSTPALIIFVVGCLVLLLACANLASLMLSRATGRARELGVRAVLGAGRGRLIQQLMVESLVIAMVGGVVGIAMGRVGLSLLLANLPGAVPGFIQFEMDGPVLTALAGIVVLSGVLFGLAPALTVRRRALGDSLRSDTVRMSAGKGFAYIRSSLVVFQIVLTTFVLSLTGIVVRGYIQSQDHRMGVDTDRLLAQYLMLPSWAYPDPENRLSFFQEGRDRLQARPEIEAAAYISQVPAARSDGTTFVSTSEMATNSERPFIRSHVRTVSPGYFATAGITLLSGRDFADSDPDNGPPLALVNASLARILWEEEDPLGRQVFKSFRSMEPDMERPIEVVGVVADVRQRGPGEEAGPCLYIPLNLSNAHSDGWLILRTAGDPVSLSAVTQGVLREIDPRLPMSRPRTIVELARERNWLTIFSTWIFTVVSTFALILALLGIMGVVAYSVTNRMREFGIRLALGADAGSVIRAVLRRGAIMAGVGIAVGMTVAFGAVRFVASVLVNTNDRDPVVFAVVFVLLASMTLLASYLPARSIAHIDPVEVLREE